MYANGHLFWNVFQHKWTPLFAAAWGGHREVVMYLLEDALCDKEVTDVVSFLATAGLMHTAQWPTEM